MSALKSLNTTKKTNFVKLWYASMVSRHARSRGKCLYCVLTTGQKDSRWDKRRGKAGKTCGSGEIGTERKHCIVTEQHVNDYVFPRLLASVLKHENKHWL